MNKPRNGPKPDKARREMIVRMRDESGMSFAAIGRSLHPQVTRQTVRILYEKALTDTGKASRK